ncbi:rRNA maturation factor [Mesotoga sp. HF07.pep.5.2.highcov]|jgi:probable rRNA maturation factor|uniref:rRNA maturation RNase YbeY n=1 Tax=unclassified Mesotoga TaxID=1184398 RepID=UPI000C1A5C4E|nr:MULTISPECIES: rRNA maturation RNase YbeY [unclassified Mesotoga]PIJ63380.1 rRNA maturation factor [Mesotoga sp. H07.pep.5.3]RLL90566.1 rRNA maturation factor [Mesotoga sp. HF07.pep.5.2.highcov]
MEIQIQNKTSKKIEESRISNIVEKVVKAELGEREIGMLNLLFTDDSEIRSINKEFRHRDEPTDVLSFQYGLEEEIVGDIVISLERISEQAGEFGNSFEEELYYILIHGVLHVLGHTHEGYDDEGEEIFSLQRDYYKRFVEEG